MNAFVSLSEPSAAQDPALPGSDVLRRLTETIAQGASERDQQRIHPYEAVGLLRQARYGALRLPREHAGGGATLRQLLGSVLELAAADSNVAHVLRNHFSFVERFVLPAPGQAPSRWLDAVAQGAIFGVAAGELSTAAVGDGSLDTTVVPDPAGGWRLNGIKFYSTGSLYADYVAVRASLPDGHAATAVVPVDRAGVRLDDDWFGMGQRLTGTGTTRLTDVHLTGDELLLDRDGHDYRIPYSSAIAQLFLTTVNAGILRAVQHEAVALVKRRGDRNFAHGLAARPEDDPVLQQEIGEIASAAFAAEATVLAAADALDRVAESRQRGAHDRELALQGALAASKAKVVVDSLTLRAATQLFDVGGASAATQRYNLDRHWRNARTLASHNPASLKARLLGQYEVHGTPLPTGGFF
ncbi:acyl-CoA dehydrogenase [Xylophilus rhododendri]|uniref:Acyl-CoA dehydrogenase n=1 Tax=Xylophilus rhododendri TaxID=2697032 RepID=A0A857JDM7_9BURK|nr:acyl-CoA dehydrogenase family protein [Xylophilus rhododendri]QHJ01314.1 acyl-CoA dehydrogenase [Xylophilus rhododendri]